MKKPNFSWKRVADSFSTRSFRAGGYSVAAAAIVPLVLWGSFAPLAAAVGYWLAVWYADRQLGGMSGDVSGFALTLGELCGLAVLTLVR